MARGKHSHAARRVPFRALLVVAVAPVVGALVAIGVDANSDGADAPPVAAAQDPTRVPPRAPAPSTTQPKADANLNPSPVGLTIPAIQVASRVTRLGLNEDKTVEVPKDPDDAGWYSNGPIPGQNGSSVILGHVDSKAGPAVFHRLKHLDPGDRIAVKLSDETVAHYQVARVAQYANRDFPAVKVYAGSPDRPALNLVTCGGKYDRDAGGYQANVVVYATYLKAAQSTM